MNLRDYQDFVASRAAPQPVAMTAADFHLIHGSFGLLGELIELQNAVGPQNLREELGDFAFYMILCSIILDTDTTKLPQTDGLGAKVPLNKLATFTETFTDLCKKKAIYQQNLDLEKLDKAFAVMWGMWLGVCNFYGFNSQHILEEMQEKLQTRYAKSFTTQESIERKDKA